MKKLFVINIILLCCLSISSQIQKSNWLFGTKGWVNFSSGTATSVSTSVFYQDYEGTSTYSDQNGNLLIYTDGLTVHNGDLDTIKNGTNLAGNFSSLQGAIVVPKPCSNNEFYIFTTSNDTVYHVDKIKGWRYSILDINQNNSEGAITLKNELLWNEGLEKQTVIRHSNQQDYWVVASSFVPTPQVRSHLFDCSGIDTSSVIVTPYPYVGVAPQYHRSGYLVSNSVGDRIAFALPGNNTIVLMDFDNATGIASNYIQLTGPDVDAGTLYGICFSPDGTKLYISQKKFNSSSYNMAVYQMDVTLPTANDINNSAVLVGNPMDPINQLTRMGMQLGIDGKLYVARGLHNSVHVINDPNLSGTACNFVSGGLQLPSSTQCLEGFPHFPNKYSECQFATNSYCSGDTSFFQINLPGNIQEISWDFGDGNTSTTYLGADTIGHIYEDGGNYQVIGNVIFTDGSNQLIETCINIPQGVTSAFPRDTCLSENMILLPPTGYTLTQQNDTLNSLNLSTPGIYKFSLTNLCETKTFEITISEEICSLVFPNIFTPNGDGDNDKIALPPNLTGWEMSIFNRWGQEVFLLDNNNLYWEGYNKKGQELSEGVYYYLLFDANGELNTNGIIQLIR